MSGEESSILSTLLFCLLIYLFPTETEAREVLQQTRSSSCGDIKNISYPFRLKGDPSGCGYPEFELSCQSNQTILELFNSAKYYVKRISYDESTISVADVNLANAFIRVPCLSGGNQSNVYVNYHGSYVSDFSESCSFVSMVPIHNGNEENPSYETLRELLETGFDLRWSVGCRNCYAAGLASRETQDLLSNIRQRLSKCRTDVPLEPSRGREGDRAQCKRGKSKAPSMDALEPRVATLETALSIAQDNLEGLEERVDGLKGEYSEFTVATKALIQEQETLSELPLARVMRDALTCLFKPYHGDVEDPRRGESRRTPTAVAIMFDKDVDYIIADRIVWRRGVPQYNEYLVKWKNLPESEATWEREDDLWQFVEHIQNFKHESATRTP
ncbi:protein kinase domain-containing protein [Citrus sinensis]|nr:protein kinase domain-containing protein [Citrus sinensis]